MLISNSVYLSQIITSSNSNQVVNNVLSNDDINRLLDNSLVLKNNVKLREVIVERATSNKEQEIANSLLEQIDKSAKELEIISLWSEGGESGFIAALELMADKLFGIESPTGIESENVLQLAMLDVLVNAQKYGVANDDVFMKNLSLALEYTGSGQHNTWVEDLDDPTTPTVEISDGIADNRYSKIVDYVWKGMKNIIDSGNASKDSLLYRVMNKLSGNNNSISSDLPSILKDSLSTSGSTNSSLGTSGYFDTSQGGWITDTPQDISPLMRLVILSNLLNEDPEMSQSTLKIILTGTYDEVNSLTPSTSGGYSNIFDYIFEFDKDGGWQDSGYKPSNSESTLKPSGVNQMIDFNGQLDKTWLSGLYVNFPSRVLGDEDIKNINRIGDNVKMIMQTLKYWLQIMRDESIAIARNI
ncbi:hypothetical protein D0B83_17975 [Vibrio cholerae]|nr:hypothetical protein [Vibrio cholerae]EGR2064614.1 hypothetical protein [Vibrio cholerae]EGR2115912.1 hypothetical protein [Vibrio cholerae]EGR2243426.1 hypothetical protein [Vibrio cholerae]